MSNLMKYRWFELRHQPAFYLLIAICYAFSLFLIGAVGEHYMTDTPMVAGVTRDWSGLFMNAAADLIFPLTILSGTFTAMLLGRQFSSRNIDLEIAAGHSRSEVFFSLSLIGFAVVNLAVLPAIPVGCLVWAGRIPMPSAGAFLPYLIRVLLLLMLLNCALFSACILFAVVFRDTARSMAVSALFLLTACWTMPMLQERLPKAPGTLYPKEPTLALYLHPAFLMRYSLYSTLTPHEVLWSCAVAVGWIVLFLSAAYCIFRRCELK
jgi:ABC-2 type transport system permease protein